MNARTVALAEQLLESVPQQDVADLIVILKYYNTGFREDQRALALRSGSEKPADPALETQVKSLQKTAGSQNTYVTTNSNVCRCCGK